MGVWQEGNHFVVAPVVSFGYYNLKIQEPAEDYKSALRTRMEKCEF
jgi:hypothetical protein